MFEKLIELFGGGAGDEVQQVEGSYLLHVLDEIRPKVREELEREPDHEPLWLVAAEVFRASSGEPLEESPYDGPLEDPDKLVSWPDESEPSAAVGDDVGNIEEDADPDADPPGASPEDDTQEFERPDDMSDAPEPEAEGADEIADDLVEEAVEVEEATAPARPSEPAAGPPPAPPSDDAETIPPTPEAEGVVDESRIDSPVMLRAARVFLGLLVDNARLPDGLRMPLEDIQRVRTLLLGYFLGKQDVAMRANELMGVVETKFSEEYYSQARMLLELFGVHRETRLENDRKLYFREISMSGMEGRPRRWAVEISGELPERLRAINEADEGGFATFFEWYSDTTGISMDVRARSEEDVEQWRRALEPAKDESEVESCLEVIPPEQWAMPGEFDAPTARVVAHQLDRQHGLAVTARYLKMVYFVLRPGAETGLEPLAERFFDWSESFADVDAVRFLPDLHLEMTQGERMVDDIIEDVCWRHYAEAVEERVADVDEEQAYDLLESSVEQLQDVDLAGVPPGHYDLSGFVADALFGIELPSPEYHFKLHRLT